MSDYLTRLLESAPHLKVVRIFIAMHTVVTDTMAASEKPAQNYGVDIYGFPDFVHVPPKKTHYDAWSSSTGSISGCSSGGSPNHLEELHVDIPHSSVGSIASTSTISHPSSESAVCSDTSAPTFTDLKPVLPKVSSAVLTTPGNAELPEISHLSSVSNVNHTGFQATNSAADTASSLVPKTPHSAPVSVQDNEQPLISHDARFSSYAEFDEAFEAWKKKCLHPFRVASSETLREPDGTVNHRFKYRYVVFHCAHYGEPRMRGIGKRPNQHYLPSGCRAMLRLNYSFSEQLLKITTLHDEHLNHEISAEMFRKVSAKLKRSSVGAPSPAAKRQKPDSPIAAPSSQNISSPAVSQAPPQTTTSTTQTNNATNTVNTLAAQMSLSQTNQMANMAIALQHQQIMASLLNQQKENINLATGLSSLSIPRPQPSMINILGMMGLQQRLLLQQPPYGLVTPLTQQITSAPQAQSIPNLDAKATVGENEQSFIPMKCDLPAPVALKPTVVSAASVTSQLDRSPRGSPPHLVPEVPLTAEQVQCSSALNASVEESLARLRNGAQDPDLITRLAQLNHLSSFWGNPTIPEFR
ncbi:hypothetical protein DICVIV_07473 [Dictyocaulus viviparus]|uniref:ZSWIM3 N-terminal domain-containing protein n=1 Tax=Dictyocaulus viviparus TaxID=29172 RepID=A0A0D8XPA9_DICVI|nr:hypothetical protein DICVIV_07473 [Dictyocaulus viviparus]